MNAVLAIIANGRQAIVFIYRVNEFLYSLYNFMLNTSMAATSNPLQRGSQGWGIFLHQNHAARWKTAHHDGDVCVICVLLAKSLPSGSFLFPPEPT